MTDEHGKHTNEEKIAKGIGDLPRVGADPAYFEKLRSAFVSGEIDTETAPERDVPARPHRGGGRWWRWATPVVATAAVVMIVFAMLNPGPPLRVLETAGEGYVRISGSPVPLADRGKINDYLHAGAPLVVPAGVTLDLISDDVAMYELVSGTRMTVPATPGRWFNRAVECSLYVGEIRMKTGAKYAGSMLRVYTPDGMVEVTGTLLSIQADNGGTCVCVLEGTARVGVDESDLEPVPPGNRKIMLKDGTVEIIPVKPMHRDGVLDFDKRLGSHMRK